VERFFSTKKEKEPKRKKWGGLWKLPQLWKKQNATLLFATVAWIKPSEKTCSILSTIPTGPATANKKDETRKGAGAGGLAICLR
jgi:hypothetical protein